MSGNEEFIQEFLVECEENLDQLDQDLVALEENPHDQNRLASIFRTIHTIKGTSGFFGYAKLGAVAHAGENLLGRLRDGDFVLNSDLTDALLRLVDAVRGILVEIQQSGGEGAGDYSPIIATLETLAAQPATHSTSADVSAVDVDLPPASSSLPNVHESSVHESSVHESSAEELGAKPADVAASETDAKVNSVPADRRANALEPDDTELSNADVSDAEFSDAMPGLDSCEDAADDSLSRDTTLLDTQAPVGPQAAEPVSRGPSSPTTAAAQDAASARPESESPESESLESESLGATPASSGTALRTIRVDVDLLNELMNQVGELVLTRNQIRPFADAIEDVVFNNALQQLDLITGDLQEGIMKTRMQSIGNLWTRLPRVVRDLAQVQGKQVQLEMYGRETELDRTLIEAIKDPLTHLVRNAVDHGIELPERRQTAGKPELGTVVLRAFHEGGMVNIEISDDGAGIDAERVREKALRLGLISQQQAARMSAHQITQLIFLPGLSTAQRVTDISGRGVGMDVVKTNIEQIGGSVTIDSRPGSGTTLRVKIPLTLAIIPALMVSAAGQRFAIPQVALREIITLFEGDSSKAIEPIGDAMVYRLRGELLPLIRLTDVLQIPADAKRSGEEFTHVVVLHAIGQRFGLIVDQIARTDEIVVKPLHKTLAQIPVFSGATVLGNGRVALILDVVGLARLAGVDQRGQATLDETTDETADEDHVDGSASEFGDFLVCEATEERRVAIPLSDVTRLEEFSADQIGARADQRVIPYRGQLMHLVSLDGFGPSGRPSDSLVYVVVHRVTMCADDARGARHIGLIVHRILDVAQAAQPIDTSERRLGLQGRTLIDDQVLDIVDIQALARAVGITFRPGSAAEVTA